jgi:hypothetical protein
MAATQWLSRLNAEAWIGRYRRCDRIEGNRRTAVRGDSLRMPALPTRCPPYPRGKLDDDNSSHPVPPDRVN